MEWLIIGLLTVFGYVQTDRLADAKAEAEKWQTVAKSNYEDWQRVVEINQGNDDVIADLKNSLDNCDNKYRETLDRINDFEEAQRVKNSAIEILRDRLANTDFGTCRVPDWVDLTTP